MSAALKLAERLIGRRQLWRIGRRIYRHARRDGSSDPQADGEFALHRRIAAIAGRRGTPFTIVEVGANVGAWSSHLLGALAAEGVTEARLVAFEPSDEVRAKLIERMKSVPPGHRVTIRPEAVAAEAGRGDFDATPGISGIKRLLTEPAGSADSVPRATVEVTTLAAVFAEESIAEADFVKSDVEGFDLRVIEGARPLLAERRIGLLQFEYNACWVETRTLLRDVFALASGLPYRLCKVVPDGIEALPAWHPELEAFVQANYILVRDDWMKPLGVHQGEFDAWNTYA